ncbi:unnamed protein product [Darwinula stevensoni]|uniref:Metaxin n=1 Tax=Darwinula stevensoni TaxID=69355 RepID=A0A7R9ACN5_9CRUS|nr:unnamed protein product [Darwinula stevensoni]CAG0900335.1 unnamed protein product [Darwinula stevensoni]
MPRTQPMTLEVWEGRWGLPSIDTTSLEVMAYAKFSGAPLKVVKLRNPFFTRTGRLPVFSHGSTILENPADIVLHFRKENHNADYELSPKESADVVAYASLVHSKLLPGILHNQWLDENNYIEFTRPNFAKILPIPFNYYYPGAFQREARRRLFSAYGLDHTAQESMMEDGFMSTIETAVHKNAVECLTLLSNRLGDKEYFFGQSPCFLDAVVFAHLAPLLKFPFPNSPLQNHLKGCPNLVAFIERILLRYFPPTPEGIVDEDEPFREKLKRNIGAALVAGSAMLAYAFFSGILRIQTQRRVDYPDINEMEEDYGEEEKVEEQNENQE